MIVDAGGGTVDVSTYRRDPKAAQNSYEEIAAPQCAHLLKDAVASPLTYQL